MKKKIDQLYSEGMNLLNDANYEEALNKFTSIKQLDENYHLVPQLYSRGLDLLNESKVEYDKALINFALIKQLDKSYIHMCCYYEGVIYDLRGDAEVNLKNKDDFYLAAERSFVQAAGYQGRPSDTYFLLGRTLYKAGKLNHKAGKLSKALSIFQNNPYPPENAKEVQEICSQIEQQLNNNSPMSLRGSYLYNSNNNSQLMALNNNDSHDIEKINQKLNEVQAQLHNHDRRIETLEDIVKATNIHTEAAVNTKIQELCRDSPELYKYYKYFNSGLRDVYIASCSINSGLVVANAGHLERLQPNDYEKIVCYILDAGAAFLGPIGTAVIGVVHDAGDNIFNSHVENNVVKILENINRLMNKQYDEIMKIETVIQQLALLFTHIKKEEILNIEATVEAQQNPFLKFFKAKILPAQKKLFFRNNDSEHDDPIVNLVFKDLTSLMSYIQYNSIKMLENPKSFAEQISIIIETELKNTWEDKVKNNPTNIIEYNILQIENNSSESEKIISKIAMGQWEDIPLPFISLSWSGVKRGIKSFFSEKYFKEQNITIENQSYFKFFLMHKIFKHGKTEFIEKFKLEYPDLIELVRTTASQLFATESNIDLCIDIEEQRKVAKDILKLKSSDYFVKQCFKTVFSKLVSDQVPTKLMLEAKPEAELSLIPFNVDSPRSDDDHDTVTLGVGNLD